MTIRAQRFETNSWVELPELLAVRAPQAYLERFRENNIGK